MGGRRLRSRPCFKHRKLSSTNCAARLTRRSGGCEEHRSHHPPTTAKAVSISNHGHAREHRPSHRRGEYVRIQVLRFHRLVDVAVSVFNEAAAPGEKVASD